MWRSIIDYVSPAISPSDRQFKNNLNKRKGTGNADPLPESLGIRALTMIRLLLTAITAHTSTLAHFYSSSSTPEK